MRYIILIFSLFSILAAFFFYQETTLVIPQKVNQDYLQAFKIPVIFDSTQVFVDDSGETEMTFSSVFAYGLFPFSDSIRISDVSTDYMYDSQLDDDYLRLWKNGDLYSSGLKLVVAPNAWIPYESRMFKASQPVYIVNETASPIFLEAFLVSSIITEAKDENGYWFPIEFNSSIGCANGKYPTKICSQEMLLVGMKKHSGSFKTELRIRLKTGSQTIVSDPFSGSIDPTQFYLSKQGMIELGLGERVKITDFGVIQNFFLGALPKQAYDSLY